MKLLELFYKALDENDEEFDDVLFMSHPLEILREISTLEEIQCFYLNSCNGEMSNWGADYGVTQSGHKQDMPFIAVTKNNIYFNDAGWRANKVDCYSIDYKKGE